MVFLNYLKTILSVNSVNGHPLFDRNKTITPPSLFPLLPIPTPAKQALVNKAEPQNSSPILNKHTPYLITLLKNAVVSFISSFFNSYPVNHPQPRLFFLLRR